MTTRIQYYDEWSREKCEVLRKEVVELKNSLDEKQLKVANEYIRTCIINLPTVFEYLNLCACDSDRDDSVMAYVNRTAEYIVYRCQEEGFRDGIECGFYADPCYERNK